MRTFLGCLFCLLICIPAAGKAETELGLAGLLTWTDNFRLHSPEGLGIFLRQSLSKKVSLRAEYDHISESDVYLARIHGGFVPLDDTASDFFDSHAWINSFELAVIHRLLDYDHLYFDFGGGVDVFGIDADIIGENSGHRITGTKTSKLGYSLIFDLHLRGQWRVPVVLSLGFRQRYASAAQKCWDCQKIFDDALSLSEIRAAISIKH